MKRDSLVWGIILIALGVVFLLNQLFPQILAGFSWPWILVALGGLFVLGSLVGRVGGLMVPGVILLGLGGIFLYQTRTGNWESWAYIWGLIPAFAGLGMLIGGFYDAELRKARPAALIMIIVGLVLFAVFGGVFGSIFGLSADILRFWPVLLILLGLWVLFREMRSGRK